MANVVFRTGTSAQYNVLTERPAQTLYWLSDVQEIRKGNELYGVGRLATPASAGLMSPIDKQNLDRLVEVSAQVVTIPEFFIEKQPLAEDGYATSYKLKRVYGEDVSYVGDVINIPKDLVLQGASLKEVSVANVPYDGAQAGDPYLDLEFNDIGASHIYVPVKGLVDTYIAGNGIEISGNVINVKIDEVKANGLVAVGSGFGLNLATHTSAGAMSAVDKIILDSLPMVYEKVEYEIAFKPKGTLINYRDKEIRVMCPNNTEWILQASGERADENTYYIGFKAYAPNNNVVSFREDLGEIITDTTMYYFENNDFAGIDEYGRKYSIVWLPVAKYDEEAGTWIYYGEKSNKQKYIGWYYSVEWYDVSGLVVASDIIRINLSNEDCHKNIRPYYMSDYATNEDLDVIQDKIMKTEQSYTWGEM